MFYQFVMTQYRKCTEIYLLKSKYEKIWMPGTKSQRASNCLHDEIKLLNYDLDIINNNVNTIYLDNFDQYDQLLLTNIIIIPLWNASANNAVLECIQMNIPFFVSRIKSTEEYLGKNYDVKYISLINKYNGPYQYNLYCNDLLEEINEGYIMFLDDDDMFSYNESLKLINNNLSQNHILLWNFFTTT